jgi:hypothetical protein
VLNEGTEIAGIPLHSEESLERRRPRALSADFVGDVPVAVWLAGIVITAAALRFVIALQTPVPWTVPDELVHSELARSFASSGHFEVRDVAFSARTWGPLYLILIAPAFRVFGSLPDAYLAVKAINCVVMSTAAVPAYLLARRLLDRKMALLLALLTVAVPSGVYTSKIMAESLAYPAFLFAALAIIRVLESQTWRGEVLAIGAIGLATLARAQLAVLLPAFVLALVIVALLDQRDSAAGTALRPVLARLARYRVTLGTAGVIALLLAVSKVVGSGASAVSGGHSEAFGSAKPIDVFQLLALHLAELDLYVMLLPFAALAVLCTLAFKRVGAWRELRPFCAFTICLTGCIVAVSSRYLAAVYRGTYLHAFDRYTFYLAPLFMIAFLVWLRAGLPRPRTTKLWVAGACALPLLLASKTLLVQAWLNPSTVALAPWSYLRLMGGTAPVYAVMLAGGAYLSWAFLRGRDREWLLMLVVANLVVVNLFGRNAGLDGARAAQREWIGAGVRVDWIDAAVGSDAKVFALSSGLRLRGIKGWHSIWEAEMLNRSVRRVYRLHGPRAYNFPEPKLEIRGRSLFLPDGRPLRAEYVLTDIKSPVVGRRVAANRAAGLIVYRVGGPVELRGH